MGTVIPKLRASARGQTCTLQIAGVCNHDPETTVLAHLPSDVAGKATKSDDWHACFACSNCHAAIDHRWVTAEDRLFYCLRALQRTMKFWIESGLIVIPGTLAKRREPSSKIVARKPSWRLRA